MTGTGPGAGPSTGPGGPAAPSDPVRHVARRRRIIVGVLILAGVIALFVSLRAPSTPGAPDPSAELSTPLWSVRRAPQPIVDMVAMGRLQSDLSAGASGTNDCFVVVGNEGVLAASEPDTPRIPASTMKVLTAAAALDALGPEFRYETRVVAANRPGADGVVNRLWLIGQGDPVIVTPEAAERIQADPETRGDATSSLAALADDIVRAGVKSIPDGITGDDSRYDRTRFLPEWPSGYHEDIGPISALTVNDNRGGPDGAGGDADPALNAADQLGRLLTARGVTVGPPRVGEDEPRDPTTIATLRSPPMSDILTAFLSSSDNLTGEMVARELAVRADRAGTTQNGVAVMKERLTALGLPTEGLELIDGSGLARENQSTCRLLNATLQLSRQKKFETLRAGLAIAGERGTLAERLQGSALQGKLRAKTGSLSGVSGLAGFVDTKEPIVFALVLNGRFGEGAGTELREQMAEAIGRYPDLADPNALVPPPAAPTTP